MNIRQALSINMYIIKKFEFLQFIFISIFLLFVQLSSTLANTLPFVPICLDNFKNIDFISNTEFEIDINLNEIGPCEWHKNKPNFGNDDFFSSNMVKSKSEYVGSKSLGLSFTTQGLKKFKRGSFIILKKKIKIIVM